MIIVKKRVEKIANLIPNHQNLKNKGQMSFDRNK